ncbi:MAG: NUDIX hydrolase [Pseudomonadota bacterium]
MSEDKQPATPVPAATILLLREGDPQLEVFMVVRHHQIDFASGALVFPGGKADPQDFDVALLPFLRGADAREDMRAVQVASIREAFEECGILLARSQGSDAIISGEHLARLQDAREPLNSGTLPLLDFLTREKLELACDQLTHFAHWITPPMMPKRFDTHFYLAIAPSDHLAVHDGYESVDSVWIQPDQAVAEAAAGKRTVIFPTLRNIEKLGTFQSPGAAIEATAAGDVIPVLPWTEQREDGTFLCIPPEAGYAISEEKMPERAG